MALPESPNRSDVSRRQLLRALAGGSAATLLAGCQGPTDGGDGGGSQTGADGGGGDGESGGSRLRLAQAKSPVEFDPVVLNDVPSLEVAMMIFDPLYVYNEDGTELQPKVAAEMPTVERDGQRWIVPLNTDVTFHNGDTVTAEDVKHTFLAPVEEETENAGEVNMIDSITAVDEATVQFDLKYQFGAFKYYTNRNIVPKSVRTEDREAFNKEDPVGSGPFTLENWTEGESVVLSRWDDYWDDPMPNISTLEFVPVEEPTTRITTLKNGKNDVVKTIPPKSWGTVEGMDSASIASALGMSYFYLAFNCNEGPTADPEVREAIDYAFSMQTAVERFVDPSGVRAVSPIPKTLAEAWDFPQEDWSEITHEQDIDQAKSMLDDNDNVPSDWEARIIVPPDEKREQIGTSVANGLSEAGYDASVQRLDWGAFLDQYVSGSADDYNMYTLGWSGSPDPDTFMYFLFSQEQIGVTNGTYYRNDEVDSAIMDARQETDRETRRELYISAVETLMQDRPHIPSYTLKNSFGVRNRVQDFKAHPIDQFSLVSEFNNTSVQ
ncbi:ABC transporter substrate-binding protein [Haloarcula sp. S1AR25-5A]|uniref:ABC transporter substrate-binding protein n=1 Tax=Haloarcula terrestris TaxID=2950533 RepID=A0AAE4JGX3_9EURY|nr:ABC transporter substrate-binding protein [Haloarcula terrestris]MDS0221947.1 ABC transporter substrate-binding protein [Haloarcula terrestris]